jgi:endogenous inhibitor of DNA gyrase (YacG/DUF329 family)
MIVKSSKSIRCPACGGKPDRNPLRPYCSIVCRVLGLQELQWNVDTYRISDAKTGEVLTTAPSFNLTPEGISELKRKAERLRDDAVKTAAQPDVVPFISGLQQPSRHVDRVLSGGPPL